MNRKPKIIKIAAALFVAYLAFTFLRNSYSLFRAGERVGEAQEKLAAAQKTQQDLKAQLRQVQSPQFIETQARDKLGLAKENEVTVILPPEEELKKIAPHIGTEIASPPPNWRQWLELFL